MTNGKQKIAKRTATRSKASTPSPAAPAHREAAEAELRIWAGAWLAAIRARIIDLATAVEDAGENLEEGSLLAGVIDVEAFHRVRLLIMQLENDALQLDLVANPQPLPDLLTMMASIRERHGLT